MPAIILPHRWRRQPQGPVAIDWAHPLAQGLASFVLPLGTAAFDIAKGVALAPSLGGPVLPVVRESGRGLRTITNGAGLPTNGAYFAPSSPIAGTVGDMTLFSVIHPLGLPTQANSLGVFGFGSSVSINQTVALMNGATDGTLIRFLVRNDANVALADMSSGSIPAFIQGSTRSIAGVFRSAGASSTYVNGRVASTAATTASGTITMNRQYVGALVRTTTVNGFDGAVFVSAAWKRALEDAEVAALSENPWQLLRPVQRRIWVEAGATPIGLVGGAAAEALASGNLSLQIALAGAAVAQATASGLLFEPGTYTPAPKVLNSPSRATLRSVASRVKTLTASAAKVTSVT